MATWIIEPIGVVPSNDRLTSQRVQNSPHLPYSGGQRCLLPRGVLLDDLTQALTTNGKKLIIVKKMLLLIP